MLYVSHFYSRTVSCAPLATPDHGTISCTGSMYEDTCNFTCDDGYELTGSDTRSCQGDGSWSGNDAVCALKGKYRYKHIKYRMLNAHFAHSR